MKRVLTNGFLILLLSVVCSVACDKDETIDDEPTYEQPAPDDDNNGGDGGDEGDNGDEGDEGGEGGEGNEGDNGGEGNEGNEGDNGDNGGEGGEGTPDVTGDEVPIPDDNFRAYCIENFDEDGDGIFSKSEASSVESLYIIYNEIKSLKGIEYFTALKTLHCYNNQLTALDVSKNTALETLYCNSNQLTTLDVSKNTALTYLDCYNNPLELLNLGDTNFTSQNFYNELGSSTKFKIISSKITKLDVRQNELQSLDVSECPALERLDCNYNQLTELDVSKTNLGNSSETYPLRCSSMSTLQTLYLKTGWSINYITRNRSETYIPSQTQIVFVD